MALFFFHIRNGPDLISDPEGIKLPDLAAVRAEAIESAREIMAQGMLKGGHIGVERQFEIADASGQIVLIVPFREAVA